MIIVYGRDSVVAVDRNNKFAAVRVTNDSAHSLSGNGSFAALIAVCKRAEVFCRGPRMLCCVDHDNPRRDTLRRLYLRIGFQPLGELMERSME